MIRHSAVLWWFEMATITKHNKCYTIWKGEEGGFLFNLREISQVFSHTHLYLPFERLLLQSPDRFFRGLARDFWYTSMNC